MAKYTIEWSELIKEGVSENGRAWKMTKMSLKDESGAMHEDVTTFDEVITGGEIEGDIIMKGKYKNFQKAFKKPKLEKPEFIKAKEEAIKKAQDRTQVGVQKAQEHKDVSIKVSSTMRDAVQLAIAEGNPTVENIESWRKWLWTNWDKTELDYPPF